MACDTVVNDQREALKGCKLLEHALVSPRKKEPIEGPCDASDAAAVDSSIVCVINWP